MAQSTSSELATQSSDNAHEISAAAAISSGRRSLDETIEQALESRKSVGSRSIKDNLTNQELTLSSVDEQSDGSIFDDIADPAPVVPPVNSRLPTTLHPLQEWEGYVAEINGSDFVAHLIDVTSGDSSFAKEKAVIPKEEISQRDVEKMHVGSIFRWVIGYEHSVSGTRKRVSQIVFRDLPIVTENDLKEGDARAQEIVHSLTS